MRFCALGLLTVSEVFPPFQVYVGEHSAFQAKKFQYVSWILQYFVL